MGRLMRVTFERDPHPPPPPGKFPVTIVLDQDSWDNIQYALWQAFNRHSNEHTPDEQDACQTLWNAINEGEDLA